MNQEQTIFDACMTLVQAITNTATRLIDAPMRTKKLLPILMTIFGTTFIIAGNYIQLNDLFQAYLFLQRLRRNEVTGCTYVPNDANIVDNGMQIITSLTEWILQRIFTTGPEMYNLAISSDGDKYAAVTFETLSNKVSSALLNEAAIEAMVLFSSIVLLVILMAACCICCQYQKFQNNDNEDRNGGNLLGQANRII